MRKLTKGMILLLVCFSLGACSHPLKVKNLKKYRMSQKYSASDRPINIGVISFDGNVDQQWCYDAIVDKLASRPYVGRIQSNYHPAMGGVKKSGFQPDCVIGIEPEIEFNGSGWNYPITFPGFIIFTHAWNGFAYQADIHTKVTIYDNAGNAIDTMNIDTPYNFRHCSSGRGTWSGLGWLSYGITSFISGFFYIQYDDNATDDFFLRIRNNYSDYIVHRIYNNSNFAAALGSVKQEGQPGATGQSASDLDALQIMLNKLKKMQSQGLISEEEEKRLREKALSEY